MNALPRTPPSNRDEHWKYANLRGLARLSAVSPPAASDALIERVANRLPPRLPDSVRAVLIDGRLVSALTDADLGGGAEHALAPGLQLRATTATADRSRIARPADRYYAEVNAEARAETVWVSLAAESRARLEILCVASSDAHPALQIELGARARLTLLERHLSLDVDTQGVTNLHWQGRVGEAAVLELARVGQHGPKMQAVETLELELEQGAHAQVVQVVHGGANSRSTAYVSQVGRDAQLDWQAATLGDAAQTHDAFVLVAHQAPGVRTRQVFRGIAAARSRVAFNGHMLVAASARGTDSAQSLRGLIAGAEAEADVRPQLEIYTDAIKASHGATVGKLDADMLFYLLSRGIDPATAESLLKWAFVSDVLARLPCAALRAQLEAALERQLPGAAAARVAA